MFIKSALVKVLTGGLPFIRQSTCQCINALSLCVVEMQDTMIKYLPDVLLSLTKNSATVQIAIPILEFLSCKYTSSRRQIYDIHTFLLSFLLIFELKSSHFRCNSSSSPLQRFCIQPLLVYLCHCPSFHKSIKVNMVLIHFEFIVDLVDSFISLSSYRFSDFIVAMAFRVMSMWFLKCRLPYRKVIISYIIRVS